LRATSSIAKATADFAFGVAAFPLLAMWRVPPWLVAAFVAAAGQLIG
jgi:hypothetical protein